MPVRYILTPVHQRGRGRPIAGPHRDTIYIPGAISPRAMIATATTPALAA